MDIFPTQSPKQFATVWIMLSPSIMTFAWLRNKMFIHVHPCSSPKNGYNYPNMFFCGGMWYNKKFNTNYMSQWMCQSMAAMISTAGLTSLGPQATEPIRFAGKSSILLLDFPSKSSIYNCHVWLPEAKAFRVDPSDAVLGLKRQDRDQFLVPPVRFMRNVAMIWWIHVNTLKWPIFLSLEPDIATYSYLSSVG